MICDYFVQIAIYGSCKNHKCLHNHKSQRKLTNINKAKQNIFMCQDCEFWTAVTYVCILFKI